MPALVSTQRIAALSKGVSPFALRLNGAVVTLNGQPVTLSPRS